MMALADALSRSQLALALALLVPAVLAEGGCDRAAPSPVAQAAPSAIPSAAPLALILRRVTVERQASGYVIFLCEAAIENAAGPLAVLSNFSSVFDGFSLVVLEGGREILRRPYVYHQSPYAQDQGLPLAPGLTAQTLGFPLDARGAEEAAVLGKAPRPVSVRLEGGLRGTPYASGLVSNTVAAAL